MSDKMFSTLFGLKMNPRIRVTRSDGGGFFGGGGGGGGQVFAEDSDGEDGDEEVGGVDDSALLGADELGDQDEINLEEDEDLATLWDDDADGDSASLTPEQRAAARQAQEQELTQQLQRDIDQFGLPDDVIPEDFNANDPAQFRQVIANAQRHAIAATMQMIFKPVQAALTHNNTQMREYVQQQMSGGIENNNLETLLGNAIPAIKDPLKGPLVRSLVNQAKKKYPGDAQKIITVTLKGLRGAGISPQATSQRRSRSTEVLDSFFPALKVNNAAGKVRGRVKPK